MRPLLVILGFLLLAAPAHGGGFATTGLSSLPDGKAAGEPWVVDIEILQHGIRPSSGAEPKIVISDGAVRRSFAAREISDGVYRAEVVFPRAGRWRYAVRSVWGVERFVPVKIAARADTAAAAASRRPVAPAAAGDDGGTPRWPIALGAGLIAALITVAALRRSPRRRVSPAA